jgi:hypothetical protein
MHTVQRLVKLNWSAALLVREGHEAREEGLALENE